MDRLSKAADDVVDIFRKKLGLRLAKRFIEIEGELEHFEFRLSLLLLTDDETEWRSVFDLDDDFLLISGEHELTIPYMTSVPTSAKRMTTATMIRATLMLIIRATTKRAMIPGSSNVTLYGSM